MCGRFYIDEETYLDIRNVVSEVDASLKRMHVTGDIHPTETAPVIVSNDFKKFTALQQGLGISWLAEKRRDFQCPCGIGNGKKNVSKWNPLPPGGDSSCRIL